MSLENEINGLTRRENELNNIKQRKYYLSLIDGNRSEMAIQLVTAVRKAEQLKKSIKRMELNGCEDFLSKIEEIQNTIKSLLPLPTIE
jgi:hypothetical protein